MIRQSHLALLVLATLVVAVLTPASPSATVWLAAANQAKEAQVKVKAPPAPDAPWIGIYFDSVPVLAGKRLSYPHETGIYISKVVEGSPAERAGLRGEDIVYRFGGTLVKDQEHFLDLMQARHPGERVAVEIYREGEERTLDVVLGSQADRQEQLPAIGRYEEALKAQEKAMKDLSDFYSRSYLTRGRIGLRLRDLNDDLASYFGVDRDTGVLVLDVDGESAADKAGIKAGDVIVAIDGKAVTTSSAVADAVGDLEEGDVVSIEIIRKGARKTFDVEVAEGLPEGYRVMAPPNVDMQSIRESLEREREAERRADEELRGLKKDDRAAKKIERELEALRERIRELERKQKELERKGE